MSARAADVSIVVPTYNGREHVQTLLASLRALDYPRDRFEIVIADDASTDGTGDAVRAAGLPARVARNEVNRRFAAAANLGARAAEGEFLFLLNNDTRVAPNVLTALLDAHAAVPDCGAVGARMLRWDGEHVLFNGGHINIEGKGFEEGATLDEADASVRPRQLFACGGAMLIRRDLFWAMGGFDEAYGMIYEDVDLGWRLNLAGYRVALAPQALVYHRLHASLDALSYARKAVFLERNALMTLYKNVGDELLPRVLGAALALVTVRTRILSDGARQAVQGTLSPLKQRMLTWIEQRLPRRLCVVGRDADDHLRAACRLWDDTPGLAARRTTTQALRRVDDTAILTPELFPRPFRLWAYTEEHARWLRQAGYPRMWQEILEIFDLFKIFSHDAWEEPLSG